MKRQKFFDDGLDGRGSNGSSRLLSRNTSFVFPPKTFGLALMLKRRPWTSPPIASGR